MPTPALVAEVEVDDETGVVEVLAMTTPTSSAARSTRRWSSSSSSAAPGWASATRCTRRPSRTIRSANTAPRDFNEYLMPGPADIAPHDIAVLERPAPDGPFGAKGSGEMSRQSADPGDRQRHLQRHRRADRHAADHAGEDPARAEGAGRRAAASGRIGDAMAVRGSVAGIDRPEKLAEALRAALLSRR